MVRDVTLGLALALLAVPAWAQDAKGMRIALPSGAEALWQETLQDESGGQGLTYRFRFVMPDLVQRVPDANPAEPARGPIDIDTDTAEVTGDAPTDAHDHAEPDMPGADADTEAAADEMQDSGAQEPAPGQDPLRDDMVWLCENWALPRVTASQPRPGQIVISLSNKEVAFGTYDPDALQLFEAFVLPADRDACEWQPW